MIDELSLGLAPLIIERLMETVQRLVDEEGLTVVEGRWFGPEDDGQGYQPVVINRAMRTELFGAGEQLFG